MKHLGLFEGIGGFSLAARWAGWETLAWCECNDFGQKVLRYHFPEAEGFGDITKTDFKKYANRIDVITGGFPCQPYSVAGKRKGKDDERHLWPEMLRAIREVRPRWVVGENVFGLVNWNGGLVFNEVQVDLEAAGYEVFPYVLPACAVNAPHRRDRVWFVAYRANPGAESMRESKINANKHTTSSHTSKQRCHNGGNNRQERHIQGDERTAAQSEPEWNGWQCGAGEVSNANNPDCAGKPRKHIKGQGQEQPNRSNSSITRNWHDFPTQSPVRGRDDGFCIDTLRQRIREDSMGYLSEKEIDKIISEAYNKWRNESIKAYGNAIVPQVAYQIFKAINEYEKSFTN